MRKLVVCVVSFPLACAAAAACGGTDNALFPGAPGAGGPLHGTDGDSGTPPSPTTTATGTGTTPMHPPPTPPGTADAGTPPAGGDAGLPGSDASTGSPCYSEPYFPTVDLSDLKNAYSRNAWKGPSLEAMNRRYPTGYFVLNAQQSDSQLGNFVDVSSWASLMQSMMMTMNAETGIYDFGHSQSAHTYVLRSDMVLSLTPVATWQRGEVMSLITDGSTSTYDGSELEGNAASDDFVTLADDNTAYTNGLGSITAVGDQVTSGISARDGVAANAYYLELYLKVGRTNHASQYAGLEASADWQKLVRYLWARAFFWDAQAKPNANLDIASAPIWAHVNEAANLDEIKQFTGDDAAYVACHP